jgi:transposase-like protein
LTNDDVIHRSRLRLVALAGEMGSVRAACRLMGVHHSTYYRWRRQLVRFGPELLRRRERRRPRMPNAIPPMVEQLTDRAHQGRRTKGFTPEQALTDRNLWL